MEFLNSKCGSCSQVEEVREGSVRTEENLPNRP